MQMQVRKRHFLRHLYIKCIILPRQARDKHRESTPKKCRFPSVAAATAGTEGGAGYEMSLKTVFMNYAIERGQVRKLPSFEPFSTKHTHFAKTGSGQT
jgi:hypothetical protein